jgi:hypothetical protein
VFGRAADEVPAANNERGTEPEKKAQRGRQAAEASRDASLRLNRKFIFLGLTIWSIYVIM